MPIDRREFLKGVGGGALLALIGSLLPKEALAQIEEGMKDGVETIVRSVCQQCPAGCGILVRCVGGWPVKIEGNPLHPVNHGALCPLGYTGIFSFYDPDRIRTPLRRVGSRGEGKWEALSWDDAIKSVAGKLLSLKETNEAHHLAIIDGEYRGLMRILFERFSAAFDTPNYFPADFSAAQGPVEAMSATHGLAREPSYDIAQAGTVFLFGSDILEASSSPAQYSFAWGRMRRGQKGLRGRAIYIGPRLSITGSKADEWVPVKPGTEGFLALGLAHVLIKESLIDNQFIEGSCNGFYGEGALRSRILSEFGPHAVSEKTGVDIPSIFRLAREFVRQKPSVAIASRTREWDQMAVHVLNALAGSINAPGGVLVPRRVDYGAWAPADPSARAPLIADRKTPDLLPKLAEKFSSGDPYKTSALFLYYSNPVFSSPSGDKFKDALENIPFIASFSPFMDETTALADLILPDRTFLERWQDVPASTFDGFPVLGISQPVKRTLYDTKHTGDVLLNIASAMGMGIPWSNFEELFNEGLKGIYDSMSGDVFGDESETAWIKLVERSGWWAPSYETFDEFKRMMSERGGWWDPSYHSSEWARVVATPSGKLELGEITSPDRPPPEAQGGDAEYPLELQVFRVLPWLKSRTGNQPWLTDIAGPHLFERWHTWAEINAETARMHGISDRDEIWVESRRGKAKAIARIYHGIVPGVVAMPVGLGHTEGGRYAKGRGSNPLSLIDEDGTVTRVKIYKA